MQIVNRSWTAASRSADLVLEDRFSGSFSGDSFSCFHGDLMIKIFNRQTKRQAACHFAEFSTDSYSCKSWANVFVEKKLNTTKIIKNTHQGLRDDTLKISNCLKKNRRPLKLARFVLETPVIYLLEKELPENSSEIWLKQTKLKMTCISHL